MTVKKILIFVGIGAIAVLVGLAGFLLYRGYRQFSRTSGTLRTSKMSLDSYYAKNPFPTDDNLKVERQNGETLDSWLDRLMSELREGQVEPRTIAPATFMTRFNRVQNDLMDVAKESGTDCPGDFAFSFERYALTGELPAPPDVPRLTQQLTMVEGLCRLLFSAGITELSSVERDVFETAQGEESSTATASPRTGRRAGRVRPGKGLSRHDAGLFAKKALSARFHFTLKFTARESAVLPILNGLATHDMFAVVTSVSFTKKDPDVLQPDREQVAIVKETQEGVDQETDGDGVVKPPTMAPSRSERIISGLERETPMQVSLEVDVYNFAKSE